MGYHDQALAALAARDSQRVEAAIIGDIRAAAVDIRAFLDRGQTSPQDTE